MSDIGAITGSSMQGVIQPELSLGTLLGHVVKMISKKQLLVGCIYAASTIIIGHAFASLVIKSENYCRTHFPDSWKYQMPLAVVIIVPLVGAMLAYFKLLILFEKLISCPLSWETKGRIIQATLIAYVCWNKLSNMSKK